MTSVTNTLYCVAHKLLKDPLTGRGGFTILKTVNLNGLTQSILMGPILMLFEDFCCVI